MDEYIKWINERIDELINGRMSEWMNGWMH